MNYTWTDVLWSRICAHCLSRGIKRDPHGLARAFCPLCTARLKPAIALHLDRATGSAWYMCWWRAAMKELRTDDMRRDRADVTGIHSEEAHAG